MEGRLHDINTFCLGRSGARTAGQTQARRASARRRSQRQRGGDLPLLRHHSNLLLQVAQTLRGWRFRGAERPLQRAPSFAERNQRGGDREDPVAAPAVSLRPAPVSYTHLRAHETKANLVCRLLLEKKKKNTPHTKPSTYQKTK